MSDDMFDDPGSASGISWENLKGALLLIEPEAVETGIKTTFGEKDAVRARVTVLTGEHEQDVYEAALIFPGVLIGQTKGKIGKMVLGRLGQGAAKQGQNPPWRLEEATEQDKTIGKAWVTARGQYTSPPVTVPSTPAAPAEELPSFMQ